MALEDGHAGNLAGGTHHAFPDHGQGFCVLNDVAICIRHLQQNDRIQRALVVDLDVHQGNGTAAIFEHDDTVFTVSVHGEKNFPARKTRSSLDVGLPPGCDDQQYVKTLAAVLPGAIRDARADCVFYLAGVDPVAGDRYGQMALSESGLERRERYVIEQVRDAGLPLVLLMSGGYAATPMRTAELHAVAFRVAVELYEASEPAARVACLHSACAPG
jgi:acetoin utilization deacetylase AcuC-like enzyme